MKKNLALLILLIISLIFVLLGCEEKEEKALDQQDKMENLVVGIATSIEDAGLLKHILTEIEKDIKYKIDVIAVGSGQAIALGETGDVDVIWGNIGQQGKEFLEKGLGIEPKDVMYNDFLLVGPEEDPAKIKSEQDIIKALAAISDTKTVFVSRGDKSGIHTKELNLWKEAGVILKSTDKWYMETGLGMGETYRIAAEEKAYTLVDRATFLANQYKYGLVVIVEGDRRMLNHYIVISVNPNKYPHINYEGASKFAEWLVSEKGQKMIGEFGEQEFGMSLFIPDAK